jgi:hypothetical protein
LTTVTQHSSRSIDAANSDQRITASHALRGVHERPVSQQRRQLRARRIQAAARFLDESGRAVVDGCGHALEADNGHVPYHELRQRYSEAVDVRLCVVPIAIDFGCPVERGADGCVGTPAAGRNLPGDADVAELEQNATAERLDYEDVQRLDVAVEHVEGVEMHERTQHGNQHV